MSLLLAIPLLAAAWAADCGETAPASALLQALADGRAAWAAMDRAGFGAAFARQHALLPCVREVLPPEVALDLHLCAALNGSLERARADELAAFRAILAIDFGWTLPPEVAPPGHRLIADFDEARGTWVPVADRSVSVEPGIGLWVDGRPVTALPGDRPFLLQVTGPDGAVRSTGYAPAGSAWEALVGPAASAPATPVGPAPLAPSPAPAPAVPDRRAGLVLLGSAGGLGLLAGGLYAVAALRVGEIERGEIACDRMPEVRTQVNSLVVAAAGSGAVALGLGVAGVAVRF